MKRFLSTATIAVLLTLVIGAAGAAAESNRGGQGNRADTPAPAFVPEHIWVDDVAHDTLILGSLPVNDHNVESFNDLYVVTNGAPDQGGPIAAYTPGDPEYRGGRWLVELVTWTEPAAVERITSVGELHEHEAAGHLTIASAPASAAFLCPILLG